MHLPSVLLELWLVAAPAEPDAVDAAIGIAQAQAAAGRFDDALATIREARASSDDPALLFVEAQLLRLHGDCAAALDRYREFLAGDPPPEDRAVAEANVETCEREVRSDPPPPAEVEPSPPPPRPPPPTDEPPPPPPRDDRPRTLGVTIALWTTGAVVLATGAGLYGAAWSERAASRDGMLTLDEYLARERRAQILSGVGIAGIVVGGAVLVAAAVRQGILARRNRASRRTAVIRSQGRFGGMRWR